MCVSVRCKLSVGSRCDGVTRRSLFDMPRAHAFLCRQHCRQLLQAHITVIQKSSSAKEPHCDPADHRSPTPVISLMRMFWCSMFTVFIICMLWCVEFWCSKSGSLRWLFISWSVGISRPRLGRQRLWRQLSQISYHATLFSRLTGFADTNICSASCRCCLLVITYRVLINSLV